MRTIKSKIGVLFTLLSIGMLHAQGTLSDYKRAIAIDSLFSNKVLNAPAEFHWIGDSLWYSKASEEGRRYVLVLPEENRKIEAFDHARLGRSLSDLLKKKFSADSLRLSNLQYEEAPNFLRFELDSLKISLNLETYESRIVDTVRKNKRGDAYWGSRRNERTGEPVESPDGTKIAYIKNHDLYTKTKGSEEETRLSYDGNGGFYYASHIQWSPDGKKILAYRVRPGEDRKIYFVESSPDDQLQPKLQERDYLKPGDEVAFRSPQLFKVASGEHLPIPTTLFNSQFSLSNLKWQADSEAFTFEYNQRGHQVYRVLKVDAETGNVQNLIEEKSPTFIDYSGKKWRYDAEETSEILWASERDGWNHLYLIDSKTGKVKNQITKGKWPVRDVIEVDEQNRHIYFTASGMDKGMDPYFIHYFRIDFDGENLTRYTKEDGNHKVFFSPDFKYYVDQYSRVDLPPRAVLKKTSDQKEVMELEKADISHLVATGWQAPEVFMAKGRDGQTDIWGIIIRPTNFDSSKKYPIIEYIYAGPHSSFVPKSFNALYRAMSSIAELGFIVVQIDGMGTSNRSKAFQDVAWRNLKDAGFPDRKLWIKAAAKKYPYLDEERVGIYGTSAGGQSSAGALVFNSEFYDVAVSSCGCHDNRMDKIWWNEQWMGYPVGPHYEESSNIENAAQLEGNLMLIVGEVDDNVDPASTFQFADALIKADKDFELVVLPGMGHTSGGEYGERKRKDFFVKHLLDVDPPSWEQIYGGD